MSEIKKLSGTGVFEMLRASAFPHLTDGETIYWGNHPLTEMPWPVEEIRQQIDVLATVLQADAGVFANLADR